MTLADELRTRTEGMTEGPWEKADINDRLFCDVVSPEAVIADQMLIPNAAAICFLRNISCAVIALVEAVEKSEAPKRVYSINAALTALRASIEEAP